MSLQSFYTKKIVLPNLIFKYKCKNKKDTFYVTKHLVNFISKYTNSSSLKDIFIQLSTYTDIPVSVLKNEVKLKIYNEYNFQTELFSQEFKFFKITKYFIILFLYCIWHLLTFFIFSSAHKKKDYDLICNDINSKLEVDRFLNLAKKFKKVCFFGKYKYRYKNKSCLIESFKYNKLFLNTNISFSNRVALIFLILKILLKSFKYKINLFNIFNFLIYTILKNKSVYRKINAKYFITPRFFATSPIQNYLFHQSGGKITSCTQRNLLQLSLSCFIFTDVMFTLGPGQGKICNKIGGNIKKFIPTGSLFMENIWYKKKRDLKKVPFSDVLLAGINVATNARHRINKDFEITYYKYISWFKKLSKEFPNKTFIIKHHANNIIDKKEREILKNTNIKILTEDKSINSTYAYIHKSTHSFSFGSTITAEFLGAGKKSYWVDPQGKNKNWYHNIKYLNKFRLRSYKEIKDIVKKEQSKAKVNSKIRKYFCLDSKKTSERIYGYFTKSSII